MSDRVTSAEIEDVLSSIRRLVSIDGRRTDDSKIGRKENSDLSSLGLKPEEKLEVDTADLDRRFLLSDSFRVGQSDDPTGAALQDSVPSHVVDVDPAAQSHAPADVQQREPEPSEPDVDDEPSVESLETENLGIGTDEPPSASLEPENWQIASETSHPEVGNSLEPDEELGEDEAQDENLGEHYAQAHGTAESGLTDKTDPFLENASPQSIDKPQTKTLEGAALGTKELEARIAEVEAAVAARDDQWEPDGSEPEASAPPPITSLPWLKTAETAERQSTELEAQSEAEATPEVPEVASTHSRPAQYSAGETKKDAEDHWYAEDAVLDEDALRDLVSEIVRQELQGSLGERITRNVRKLVRREIHRAMMGQEFD